MSKEESKVLKALGTPGVLEEVLDEVSSKDGVTFLSGIELSFSESDGESTTFEFQEVIDETSGGNRKFYVWMSEPGRPEEEVYSGLNSGDALRAFKKRIDEKWTAFVEEQRAKRNEENTKGEFQKDLEDL